jgi:ring-1,2-phenylacetyl-CoA epoxidase subunit PaaD
VTAEEIRSVVARVPDPEIPVLTIDDLGILREVDVRDDEVVVTITPTYSGCPALAAIRADIGSRLRRHGIARARVEVTLTPPWTTDWMSEAARRKLRDYGIAPPGHPAPLQLGVCCPRCGSLETRERSGFGSTLCQAQYVCERCHEPFDHFRAH